MIRKNKHSENDQVYLLNNLSNDLIRSDTVLKIWGHYHDEYYLPIIRGKEKYNYLYNFLQDDAGEIENTTDSKNISENEDNFEKLNFKNCKLFKETLDQVKINSDEYRKNFDVNNIDIEIESLEKLLKEHKKIIQPIKDKISKKISAYKKKEKDYNFYNNILSDKKNSINCLLEKRKLFLKESIYKLQLIQLASNIEYVEYKRNDNSNNVIVHFEQGYIDNYPSVYMPFTNLKNLLSFKERFNLRITNEDFNLFQKRQKNEFICHQCQQKRNIDDLIKCTRDDSTKYFGDIDKIKDILTFKETPKLIQIEDTVLMNCRGYSFILINSKNDYYDIIDKEFNKHKRKIFNSKSILKCDQYYCKDCLKYYYDLVKKQSENNNNYDDNDNENNCNNICVYNSFDNNKFICPFCQDICSCNRCKKREDLQKLICYYKTVLKGELFDIVKYIIDKLKNVFNTAFTNLDEFKKNLIFNKFFICDYTNNEDGDNHFYKDYIDSIESNNNYSNVQKNSYHASSINNEECSNVNTNENDDNNSICFSKAFKTFSFINNYNNTNINSPYTTKFKKNIEESETRVSDFK